MDFNLILLFAGLGLLALVALCALLGFIAGLKRELTCIAVFVVLLILTWLVFGDAATILNAKFGQPVANLLGINDSSIVTLWDAIVAFAKTIIPNGESLLVEGKETYTLFLSVVSTVCRAAGLLVGTIAILIICPIIRFITFIVRLIIKKVKSSKAKAKEKASVAQAVDTEDASTEENVEVVEMNETTADEQIVVDNEGDEEEAIITTDENEIKKGNGKRRILGAVAGAVKGLFVAILICVPLSGITSILDTASEETEKLLSDVVNGNVQVEVSTSIDPVEMVFDFAEAYDNSAVGKFDSISAFFFKESFSQRLFDQLLKMELADEKIYLTDEIKVFIEAANGLEGNVNFTTISKEEFATVLNAFKDSKLIAKLMPVVIEYAAEMDSIKEILGDENVAFLDLRYINWKGDIDLVLDAVIEAYDLGLFPLKDLNVLTLEVEELRDVVEKLGQTELMNEAYPLIVKVVLKLEALQKLVGDITADVNVDDLDIAKELNLLVDIYGKFQKLGITSLENLDVNAILKDILTNEEKLDVVVDIAKTALDLQVAQAIAVHAVFGFIENNEKLSTLFENAGQLENFMALENVFTLEDVKAYLDVVKVGLDLVDLSQYPEIKFDALALNPDVLTEVVDKLFNIEVTDDLLSILGEVALNLDSVKNLLGGILENFTLEGMDWELEFKTLISIYSSFLELGIKSEDLKGDINELIRELITSDENVDLIFEVLKDLLDLQLAKFNAISTLFDFVENNEKVKELFENSDKFDDLLALENDITLEDIKGYLDAVKPALDLVDLSQYPEIKFDAFNLNPDVLTEVVDKLFNVAVTDDLFAILSEVAVNLDVVTNLLDGVIEEVNVEGIDWESELKALVEIYAEFLKLELTSEDVKGDLNELVKEILNNEDKLDVVLDIANAALDLQLAQANVITALFDFVENNEKVKELFENSDKFNDLLALENDITLEDIKGYLDVVKPALDLVDLSQYPEIKFDAFNLNPDVLTEVVDKLFNVAVTDDLFAIFSEVAINLDVVKDLLGAALDDVTVEGVDWESELKLFIDIYSEFLKLDFKSVDDFKGDIIELVKEILNDDEKTDALTNALNKLIDAQVYSKVVAPIAQYFLNKTLVDANFGEFEGIINIKDLTNEQLHDDVDTIFDILENAKDLGVLENLNPFDFNKLDITSEEGSAILKDLISNVFDLNILGDDATKTEIFIATIEKFDWTTLPDNFDKACINWENEEAVILALVDLLKEIDALEEFDIHDLANTNWVELLENEEFIDYVVSVLETLVDSNIFVEVLPGIIEKYLLPKLEFGKDFDDTELFKDILDKFGDNAQGSKELVDEIIKLIDIVRAAIDLNLLGAKDEGLGAIDLANTEALKTIVNGIFESKFLEGNEGRIIRIILKLAKVLDIPMHSDLYNELVSIDYTGEQEMLIAFIDALTPVLKDEEFSIVNDEGKLIIDLNFWTKDQSARALLNALDTLLGAYEDENANGSKLAAVLLPSLYDKYVEEAGLIPDNFLEVVEILDITNASGESLMHDISCLTYIIDKLVDLKALDAINGNDFAISSVKATEIICEILDVLYDINLFKGNETEFVEWAVNYALGLTNIEIDLTDELNSISSEDWLQQKDEFKEIIRKVASLLRNDYGDYDNEYHIYTYGDLLDFIQNKDYATDKFIQAHLIDEITDLLDELIEIKLFKVVIPEVARYGINILKDKGYNLTYALSINADGKRFNEYIFDDLHALFEIIDYAALELNLCEYINAGFKGDLSLPDVEKVQTLIDMIYNLTFLREANGEFANIVANKVLAILDENGEMIITIDDLLIYVVDWEQELAVLKEMIVVAYNLLDAMNANTLDDIRTAISEQQFLDINMVREETFAVLSDALRVIAKSQLLGNVIEKLYNFGIFKLADGSIVNLPFAIEYLKDLSKEALIEDIYTIADLIDDLVDFGLCDIIKDKNVENIDLEKAALIFEKLYELNIINDRETELFYNLYNYVLSLAGDKLDLSLSYDEIATMNFKQEFVNVANVIRSLEGILEVKNISDLAELLEIVKEKEFTNKEFYSKETLETLIDIIIVATDLQLIDLITPQLVDFVVSLADNKGIDLSFLNDGQYADLLVEDLILILEYVKEYAYDAGLIDFVFDKSLNPVITEALVNILDFLPETNLMKEYSSNVFAAVVSKLYGLLNIYLIVEADTFENVDVKQEVNTLKDILVIVSEILDVKEINELDMLKQYINGKFYLQKDVLDGIHENVQTLINKVLDLQLIELTIVDIFDKYVGDIKFANFEKLKGELTSEELISDLRCIVASLDEIVDAKLIGLVFGESVEELEINLDAYESLLIEIKDLNIVNKHWDYIAAALINAVLDMLTSTVDVKPVDYAYVSFASELEIIINAFPELDAVIKALTDKEVYTVGDILEAVKGIKVNADLVDVIDAGINLAEKLIELETLQNSLDELIQAVADKFTVVDFLADDTNKDDLLSDIKDVLAIARIALDAGLVEEALTDVKSVTLDFVVIEEILNIVKDMNLLKYNWNVLAELSINKALKALSENVKADRYDYRFVSFTSEIKTIIDALPELEALVKVLTNKEVSTIQDVLNAVKEIKVNADLVDVIDAGINVAEKLIELETLQLSLDKFVVAAAEKFDVISFLDDYTNNEKILSDIEDVLEVARIALAAGLVEEVLTDVKSVTLDFALFEGILNVVKDLYVVNENWADIAELVVNKLVDKLTDKVDVTADDFLNISFASEIEIIIDAFPELEALVDALTDQEVSTVSDLLDSVKTIKFNGELVDIIDYAIDALTKLVELETLYASIDVLVVGLSDKFEIIDFLSDDDDKDLLINDIKSLLKVARILFDAEVFEYVLTNNVLNLEFDFDAYEEALNILKDVSIIDYNWEIIANIFVNLLLEKLGSSVEVEYTNKNSRSVYTAAISYKQDIDSIIQLLNEFEELTIELGNANTINAVINCVKDIKSLKDNYRAIAEELLDVLEAFLGIEFLRPAYAGFAEIIGNKVNDIAFLFEDLTSEDIELDIRSLVDMLHSVLDYGLVEFVYENGEIDVTSAGADVINNAISTIFNLNMVKGSEEQVIEFVLGKVDLDIDVSGFEWDTEIKELQDVISSVYVLLENSLLNSLETIKGFIKEVNVVQFVENNESDLVTLLHEFVESDICMASIPVVLGFVLKSVAGGELEDLLDNVTKEELTDDIYTLVDIIDIVVDSKLLSIVYGNVKPMDLELEFDVYKDVLEKLSSLNVVDNNWDILGVLVANVLTNKFDVEKLTSDDFEGVSFEEDINKLVEAISILEDICEHLDIVYVSDYKKALDYLNAKDIKVLNRELAEQVVDILSLVNDVETLRLLYPVLTVVLDDMLVNKGLDLGFLFEGQTSETLSEDFESIIDMLDQLIEFGIVEFVVMNEEVSYEDTSAITNILETIFGLNLVQGNERQLLEFALDKAGINKDAAELDLIVDWNNEVAGLNEIIVAFIELLDEKDLTSMANIYEMLYVKAYLEKDFYDPITGDLIENLLLEVAESNLIISLLPAIVEKALDGIAVSGLDFLRDLTAEEIASDIVDLASAVPAIIDSEILPVLFGGNVKELKLNFDAYCEILECFENMNILNKGWANIVEIVINLVLNKLGSDYTTTAAEYADIVFYEDVQNIKAVLEALGTLCKDLDVVYVSDFSNVLSNIKDIDVLNCRNLNDVVEVLEAIINIETLQKALPSVGAIATAIADKKGLDIAFLFEGQTSETLTQDMESIVSMIDTLVQSGLVEFLFMDEKYDLNNIEPITNVVSTLANLNMLQGNGAPVLKLVLGKLGVDVSEADLDAIDYGRESELLSELIVKVVNIALATNCVYIKDIYEINFKDFLLPTERTNDFIQNFADIFDILSESDVIEELVLPISAKFLANVGNLTGLLDLHNIYNDGSEFSSDLAAIRDILLGLKELDVFGMVHGFVKFPFDKNETINEMITALFTMNYLNNGEARFETIAHAIGRLIKIDLEQYDFSKVDLAADAPKLCAMVNELSLVLTNENWLVVDATTVNPFEIKKEFLTDYEVIENTLDALTHLVSTTLYTEVGGLAVLAFPMIEKAAPDFYNALGLRDTDFAEMKHEIAVFGNIITELGNLEVVEMHKTYDFFTKDFRDIIVNVLNGLDESSILSDHINDLVEVLVDKFLYGKKFGNQTLGYDFLDIAAIDFAGDKDRLIAIIDEFYTLLLTETYGEFSGKVYEDFIDEMERYSFVYGLHDLNDYIYSMTKNLYTYFEFEYRYVFFENVIDLVLNSSLLQTNGLALVNNFVTPLVKGQLANVLDFSSFTNEEFAEDLTSISTLVKQVRELGLYTVIRDENINYDQADLVNALFANIAELNYFDHNLYALIDFVENLKVVPFSIIGLKSADFDIEHDIKVFGEIYELLVPILTSDAYVFVKKSIYQDFINNNHKFITSIHDVCYEYKYNLVEVYEKLVSITAIPLVFQDAIEFIKSKTSDKVDNIIDAMNIDALTPAQIKEDLFVTADILRTLVDMNIDKVLVDKDLFWYHTVYSTLTGTPVECQAIDLIKLLIDQVHSLNLLSNRGDILIAVLEALGVDATSIDLSSITDTDWDNEVEVLKVIIDEVAAFVAPYGIHSVGELTHYINNVLMKLNNKDNLVNEIQAMYNMLDFAHLGNIFTALGDSKVLDEIFTPTYMSLVHSKVPSDMKTVLDLTDYTPELIDEDLDYLATICYSVATVRNVEIELDNELKDNVENAEVINATADAIRALLSLNVLTLKLEDIVTFVDGKVAADLSGLNVENIDLKADANLIADLADHMLYIIGATNYVENWKEYYHLGDTTLMTHVVELYEGMIETSLVKEGSYWARDEYASKVNSFIPEFESYTNAEVDLLLANLAVTLDAMLEMGVFSNTAIDFTDSNITDRFFTVFEQIYANKENVMKHVNKIKANAALLGIIPINYADMVYEEEHTANVTLVDVISDFLDNYKSSLSNNFVSLADPQCQIDITEGFVTGFVSKLFAQLAVPFANGLIKIYTVEKVQLNILDGFDNDSFISQFLPDLFTVIDALYPIGALEKTFNYNDADALIDLAYALIFNSTTEPHLSDITKYLLTYADVDVTSMDLSAVVWEDEYAYISGALTALKAPLASLNLSDLSTFQNNEFLIAASVACTYLENSELVAGIGRYALDTLVGKVFGNEYDEFRDHLFAATYSDELFKEDFGKLDEIFVNVAASNCFNGGLDYANFDPVVKVVEILLNLNYVNGIEEQLIAKVFSFIPVISDYTIDYTQVTNWATEKVEFVEVMQAMADLFEIANFDNITAEDLHNVAIQNRFVDLVQECSESVIGLQLLPAVYADSIVPLLGSDYQDIIDFSDSEFTPDMWAEEFEKAFDLNDALVAVGYNDLPNATLAEAIEIMELLFGPSIIDYELGIYTATRNDASYEKWIDRLVAHDIIKVGDNLNYSKEAVEVQVAQGTYTYKEETYRIMDLMEDLNPFTNAEGKFQMDVLYASDDKLSLNAALTEMSEVIGLRGNLYQVVQDAPDVVSTALNADESYYNELQAWLGDKKYYGSFWTEENLEDLADKIANA